MQFLRTWTLTLLAAACLFAWAGEAIAKPMLYRGEYSLTFLGIPVARATFDSRVDAGSYSVKGAVSSAGLAKLFDDTTGTLSARGSFSREATRPDQFRADYVSGKKKAMVELGFSGGEVVKVVNVPPLRRKRNWVPLRPGDLEGVADPLAAMLIPADSPERVCGRTVRLFDGELRADLALSFAGRGIISTGGHPRETVTCIVGFEPVSGYRTDRRALQFLRSRARMKVAFAQLGETGIYAPVHATVSTEIGPITVRARRIEIAE
jgi:hypothetical protein